MSAKSNLDPLFFHVFGTWFNVDTIDLKNREEVRNTAGVCASELAEKVPDQEKLVGDLSNVLQNWNPVIVREFTVATDTAWRFNQETEDTLKFIVSQLIEDLRYFKHKMSN